ncbi:MAG: sensor domain-containing diguanylate cyclase [Alphaproteobacteria bacterium]|nr:sensor domain-containing diguanylate cyclase [Alphaproteobacteria bacterium]
MTKKIRIHPTDAPSKLTHINQKQVTPDFRSFFDEFVQGIIVHRNFKPLYANNAFASLFGYKNSGEVLALPLLRELVPNDLWPSVEIEYDEMMRGLKEAYIGRSRCVHKNGQEFWCAITLRVIDWLDGPAMMLTAYDITQQVELEYGLLTNEQKLRSVLEILPYPIYISRRSDGQIMFVNRKSCLLFQKSAGQFLRSTADELFVDPQDRQNLLNLFQTISDVREIEVRMKTSQNRSFIAELASIAIDYNGDKAFLVALNDISQRKILEAELFRQASIDALTGINNRGHFQSLAEQEVRRARRFSRALTALMIDIDFFKPINDTFGHAAGDVVLQGIVKRATESLRQSDCIGRVGGEEFAVLLPETSISAAYDVADRLRKHIEEKPIVAGHQAISCTVSIGIAELIPEDSGIDDLLRRADKALYAAKQAGRNRVEPKRELSESKISVGKRASDS